MALIRNPGTMYSEAVALARQDVGKEPMPAEVGHLGKINAFFSPIDIKEAEFNAVRCLGKDGKVGAMILKCGTKRIWFSRPHFHG